MITPATSTTPVRITAAEAEDAEPPSCGHAPVPASTLSTSLTVSVHIANRRWRAALPAPARALRPWVLRGWAEAAGVGWQGTAHGTAHGPLLAAHRAWTCTLVLASDAHVRTLNAQYRGKDAPTNVLSFAALDAGLPIAPPALPGAAQHLGDIILALGTIQTEAAAAGRTLHDHAAHLVVHGLLHLCGYDHQSDADAERMEALERRTLLRHGLADPYLPLAPVSARPATHSLSTSPHP